MRVIIALHLKVNRPIGINWPSLSIFITVHYIIFIYILYTCNVIRLEPIDWAGVCACVCVCQSKSYFYWILADVYIYTFVYINFDVTAYSFSLFSTITVSNGLPKRNIRESIPIKPSTDLPPEIYNNINFIIIYYCYYYTLIVSRRLGHTDFTI